MRQFMLAASAVFLVACTAGTPVDSPTTPATGTPNDSPSITASTPSGTPGAASTPSGSGIPDRSQGESPGSSLADGESEQATSGLHLGSRQWSGEILITGDTTIAGNLVIAPGTVIRFLPQDDTARGDEIPADGHNDLDPTRLVEYATSHADLVVLGRLTAEGTASQPITFTSAAESPALADWSGLIFMGDGSVLRNVIVEWSRNGVTPQGAQPRSLLTHSTVRHAMWGCVSSGESGMQIIENDISDCGHEGIDINGGDATVTGNRITDSYAGIVILAGSPVIDGNTIEDVGGGITVATGATPTLGANTVQFADPDSSREWRFGDFAYRIFQLPPGASH